jgi:hypothetical protein
MIIASIPWVRHSKLISTSPTVLLAATAAAVVARRLLSRSPFSHNATEIKPSKEARLMTADRTAVQ